MRTCVAYYGSRFLLGRALLRSVGASLVAPYMPGLLSAWLARCGLSRSGSFAAMPGPRAKRVPSAKLRRRNSGCTGEQAESGEMALRGWRNAHSVGG